MNPCFSLDTDLCAKCHNPVYSSGRRARSNVRDVRRFFRAHVQSSGFRLLLFTCLSCQMYRNQSSRDLDIDSREPRPASIFSLAFLERVRRVLDQFAIRSTLICSSNATNSILVVVVVNRVQTVILFRPRLFIHSDFFLSPLSLLEKLIL